jgi:ABC-2 type transport system permease protein
MMCVYRIGAVVFRQTVTILRAAWIIEMGYWTLLDIALLGLLAKTSALLLGNVGSTMVSALITNAVLWYLVFRGALAIGFTLLNDLYDANFIALFATPLRLMEWMVASAIVGSIASFTILLIGWITALFLFNCNVLALGAQTTGIVFSLVISGWIVGLLLTCILLYFGKRWSGLPFAVCWSFALFSCVYYSIDVLPTFLHNIALFVPMAYVFTATRMIVATGSFSWQPIYISFLLNAVYLVVACMLFIVMFARSKKRGLTRLELE